MSTTKSSEGFFFLVCVFHIGDIQPSARPLTTHHDNWISKTMFSERYICDIYAYVVFTLVLFG